MDWIWAGAGLLGIGGVGFVAAMFFAPQVAATVGQLFLAFIDTRIGLAVVVGIACLFGGDLYRARIEHRHVAAVNASWQKRVNDAAARWNVAKVQRDADVSTAIDQLVDQATRDVNARADELQRQIDDAKRTPHPACVLGPDDVGGVRH